MIFATNGAMKKFVLTLIILFTAGLVNMGYSANNGVAAPPDTTGKCEESFFSLDKLNDMICYAQNFIGIPYHYGSVGTTSFDCSGFTSYIFKQFGLELPRSSRDQSLLGFKVKSDQARKGDLIFFKGRSTKSSFVGHVGIVVSEIGDKLTFIHASVHKGITIDNIDLKYYKDRFLYVKRILEN